MNYPGTLRDLRTAMILYVLPDGHEEVQAAYDAAMEVPSPVVQIVGVFDALKGHTATLDVAGLKILAGCAHRIIVGAWHGKVEEALGVRDIAVALIPAPEPEPESP